LNSIAITGHKNAANVTPQRKHTEKAYMQHNVHKTFTLCMYRSCQSFIRPV